MRVNGSTLQSIYGADPNRALRSRRFVYGTVVSVSGGMVEVNVGARLPSGTAQNYSVPAANGFNPSAGQTVVIVYANDSPHSGLAAAIGTAAAVSPG